MTTGTRATIEVDGLPLSYLDFGGAGVPLLCLHGHYSCARTYAAFAATIGDRWRVIALDQRGHGWSGHAEDVSRDAYVRDVALVVERLELAPAVLVGHSLGGVNAYQLAARRPDLVRAVVIEDIGAVVADTPAATLDWPTRFASLRALLAWARDRHLLESPYFLESIVEHPDGWGFRFDYAIVQRSLALIAGDHWSDWLASSCPALLIHGTRSWAVDKSQVQEMATRRPGTRLSVVDGAGHTVHDDAPGRLAAEVTRFLEEVVIPAG